jgi:hypothetical protein
VSEDQKSDHRIPAIQVPEDDDIPAEDATSSQVMFARERSQAEGDVDEEDDIRPARVSAVDLSPH